MFEPMGVNSKKLLALKDNAPPGAALKLTDGVNVPAVPILMKPSIIIVLFVAATADAGVTSAATSVVM